MVNTYFTCHSIWPDLDVVRNLLLQRLGPDFTRSIMEKRNSYVSQRVLKAMSLPIPSAYHLDHTLREITENHGILWFPDPPPRDFMFVHDCIFTLLVLYSCFSVSTPSRSVSTLEGHRPWI